MLGLGLKPTFGMRLRNAWKRAKSWWSGSSEGKDLHKKTKPMQRQKKLGTSGRGQKMAIPDAHPELDKTGIFARPLWPPDPINDLIGSIFYGRKIPDLDLRRVEQTADWEVKAKAYSRYGVLSGKLLDANEVHAYLNKAPSFLKSHLEKHHELAGKFARENSPILHFDVKYRLDEHRTSVGRSYYIDASLFPEETFAPELKRNHFAKHEPKGDYPFYGAGIAGRDIRVYFVPKLREYVDVSCIRHGFIPGHSQRI